MKATSSTSANKEAASAKPFFNKGGQDAFFSNDSKTENSFFNASGIQASMAVGQPDDPFEQEAEKVSRQVVDGFDQANSIQRKFSNLGLQQFTIQPFTIGSRISRKLQQSISRTPLFVQAKCAHCDEEEKMQKKSGDIQFEGEGATVSPAIENQIQSMKGGGHGMDSDTKTAMESSFGADFSGVRVHTNSQAVQMSQQLNAHAFTVGNDIFFNEGRYQPQTKQGAGLLAHELTHTVQQGASVQNKRISTSSLSGFLSAHSAAHRYAINGGKSPGLSKKEMAQLEKLPEEEMLKMQQLQMVQMKGVDKVQKKGSVGIMRSCGSSGGGSATTLCSVPLTMTKVISGPFQNGLTMDSYYPDLTGAGYYNHPGTAGPFDTGTRAGSNVQLVGTIPASCTSSSFTLGQTVKYTNTIKNGVRHPMQGVVQDDLAKSGRNFSTSPFRQEWTSSSQINISMADPPSKDYGPGDNIEWDREFVTSLNGPGGNKQVSWSTSIRVVNGVLTRNTVS